VVLETLGCVLKDADDIKKFRAEVGKNGTRPSFPPTRDDRALGAAMSRSRRCCAHNRCLSTVIQVLDAVRALDHLDILRSRRALSRLRTVFVSRPEEAPIFDRAFHAFWRGADPNEQGFPDCWRRASARTPKSWPSGRCRARSAKRWALDTWG